MTDSQRIDALEAEIGMLRQLLAAIVADLRALDGALGKLAEMVFSALDEVPGESFTKEQQAERPH